MKGVLIQAWSGVIYDCITYRCIILGRWAICLSGKGRSHCEKR